MHLYFLTEQNITSKLNCSHPQGLIQKGYFRRAEGGGSAEIPHLIKKLSHDALGEACGGRGHPFAPPPPASESATEHVVMNIIDRF